MTSVQDYSSFVELYLGWLSEAGMWYEENLDTSDNVTTLTAVNETHTTHDFSKRVLNEMQRNKLVEMHIEPHTSRRYWRVI